MKRCWGIAEWLRDLLQVVDFAMTRKWPQKWWCRRPPQPKAPDDLSAPGPDKCAYFDPVATDLSEYAHEPQMRMLSVRTVIASCNFMEAALSV